MGVYKCTETGGGGDYTVGNNVIYVQFKGG